METVILAYSKPYYAIVKSKIERNYPNIRIVSIEKKEQLTRKFVDSLNPTYIFFIHWSFFIPKEIYSAYECVIFHMTDLPFGRGGSPLQNLIARGIYQTKISAVKCIEEIDAGPVYLKSSLSLHGDAEEIYIRAGKVIEEMIIYMLKNNPIPLEQQGEVVNFTRRTRSDGNIADLNTLEQLFNYIRMLDAEGYPNAFFETDNMIFEFSRASLKTDYILADVKISRKDEQIDEESTRNSGASR